MKEALVTFLPIEALLPSNPILWVHTIDAACNFRSQVGGGCVNGRQDADGQSNNSCSQDNPVNGDRTGFVIVEVLYQIKQFHFSVPSQGSFALSHAGAAFVAAFKQLLLPWHDNDIAVRLGQQLGRDGSFLETLTFFRENNLSV